MAKNLKELVPAIALSTIVALSPVNSEAGYLARCAKEASNIVEKLQFIENHRRKPTDIQVYTRTFSLSEGRDYIDCVMEKVIKEGKGKYQIINKGETGGTITYIVEVKPGSGI